MEENKQGKGIDKNEGEGSRSADRAYTKGVQSFINEDRVERAAREAKDYVEEHPTEAERDEMAGKVGPKPIAHRLEELATEGKAMFHRAVERVKSAVNKRMAR
jgi:hypothetical protein